MKWVTQEKARVDRIACPWLITRFIDKEPTFLFVLGDSDDNVPRDGHALLAGPGGGRDAGVGMKVFAVIAIFCLQPVPGNALTRWRD
jgi:hypothetical protein